MIIPLTRTEPREARYRWVVPLFLYRYVFAPTTAKPPADLSSA
ncbi:hypothetical protein [Chitinivorax sp. B]|nr:hypothetical protein [Chitinivorax sp. B]